MDSFVTHRGGCHCGAVRFEVDAPAELVVLDCNCSLCSMFAFLHLIVPASRFRLLTPASALRTYAFGTGTAKHHFCGTCGVKSFYIPRSNPDGLDVNARCLDQATVKDTKVEPFDGRNWESVGASIAYLSKG